LEALAPGFWRDIKLHQLHTPCSKRAPSKEKIWFYPIDHATNTATFSGARFEVFREISTASVLLAASGVAPAWWRGSHISSAGSLWMANMDSPEASVGNTVIIFR